MKSFVSGFALICVLAPGALAANCGAGLYLEINGRMHAIAGQSTACGRALNTRASIATVCSRCRVPVTGLLALEALMRKNTACFRADRDKKALKELAALRENLRFLKRGCGF